MSYLTPDAKLVPVFNCNPSGDIGPACEPQGTRWHDGKLYVTTRHLGILVYDPDTKKLSSLVSTFHNELFKGPNDLDFDAEGEPVFHRPLGHRTRPGCGGQGRCGLSIFQGRDSAAHHLHRQFPQRHRGFAG